MFLLMDISNSNTKKIMNPNKEKTNWYSWKKPHNVTLNVNNTTKKKKG